MMYNIPEWEYMLLNGKWPHKTINGKGVIGSLVANEKYGSKKKKCKKKGK